MVTTAIHWSVNAGWLRGSRRWIVPLTLLAASATQAAAQIGCTRAELATKYRVTEGRQLEGRPEIQRLSLTDPNLGELFQQPLRIDFDTSQDQCVSICGIGWDDTRETTLEEAESLLDKCGAHKLSGKLRRVKWKRHVAFGSVFPALGEPFHHDNSFPILRPSGVQMRTITMTPSGIVESPWTDVLTLGGHWNSSLFGKESDTRFVLISHDAALYAIVSVYGIQSTIRDNLGTLSSNYVGVRDVLITTPEIFWSRIVGDIRGLNPEYENQKVLQRRATGETIAGDDEPVDYESRLTAMLPAESVTAVRRFRLAAAYATVADDGTFDWSRLLSMREDLLAEDPELESVLETELANTIPDCKRKQQLFRLRLLMEFGTPHSFAALNNAAGAVKNLQPDIYSVLRQLAEKHGRPAPPDDEAARQEWTQWSDHQAQSSPTSARTVNE
jgi:hypothetical protein